MKTIQGHITKDITKIKPLVTTFSEPNMTHGLTKDKCILHKRQDVISTKKGTNTMLQGSNQKQILFREVI